MFSAKLVKNVGMSIWSSFLLSVVAHFCAINCNFATQKSLNEFMSLISNILLMIVSPAIGWDRIGKLSIPPKIVQNQVLFPTLAVLALSSMSEIFFTGVSLTNALVDTIIEFAAYFFTFYISSIIMNFYSPGESQDAKDRMDNMLMFAMEYILLLSIIENLLPSDFSILKFLMLYVVIIMYSGLGYVNYKGKSIVFVGLASASLLLTPWLIMFILKLILPVTTE